MVSPGTYGIDGVGGNILNKSSVSCISFTPLNAPVKDQTTAFWLYPNPGTGLYKLSIPITDGELKVIDMNGQLVWSNNHFFGDQLDLQDLELGQYIILLHANNKYFSNRIIKE